MFCFAIIFSFNNKLFSQIEQKKEATYEYAILVRPTGLAKTLEVIFENHDRVNLYKVLQLDTVVEYDYLHEVLLLKCLSYLDKQGFEAINSYDGRFVFRRKRKN